MKMQWGESQAGFPARAEKLDDRHRQPSARLRRPTMVRGQPDQQVCSVRQQLRGWEGEESPTRHAPMFLHIVRRLPAKQG